MFALAFSKPIRQKLTADQRAILWGECIEHIDPNWTTIDSCKLHFELCELYERGKLTWENKH